MAEIYIGKSGKKYIAMQPSIAEGGEGIIYKIEGMPDYVLKIYKTPTETLHRKLLAMQDIQLSQSAMKQVAWPIDIVYQNNMFCGYVMVYLRDRDILNMMHSDKYNYTLKEKITMGKNLCAVVNSIHSVGQVCGDLNPKNILIDPKTLEITLVDTDSFHIKDIKNNRIYRCEVGMPLYLAKEVQDELKKGYDLRNVPVSPYSRETDLFALAVHIFSLLMNGAHPYACAINGANNMQQLTSTEPSVVAPQPVENIVNGFFPFCMKKTGITIPQYAPELDTLPNEIQNLCIRAFVNGTKNPSDRPTATEWFHALERMQGNLTTCTKNKKHMYNADLKECPWCKVEDKIKKIGQQRPKTQPITQTINYYPQTYTNTSTNSKLPPSNSTKKISAGKIVLIILAIIICSALYNEYKSTKKANEYNNQIETIEKEGNVYNAQTYVSRKYNATNLDSPDISNYNEINDNIEGQEEKNYTYIASTSGTYAFYFEKDGDLRIDFLVNDKTGDEVGGRSDYTFGLSGNLVYVELEKNEQYTITINNNSKSYNNGKYTMYICPPKGIVDVSNYSVINDNIQYVKQEITYKYTAQITGEYEFIKRNVTGNSIEVEIVDESKNSVQYYSSSSGSNTINARLEAGKNYYIIVTEDSSHGLDYDYERYGNLGNYTILIKNN